MKKETNFAFRKKIWLLGKRKKDGRNVYLEAPSWDCGWYWGFGYLETYTNNKQPQRAKDIYTHSHFDGDIINGRSNTYNNFKEYFEETPLSDDEIWKLCDYMKTFYTLKETAAIFGRGYSHFTEKAKIDEIHQQGLADDINKIYLPKLFENITKIFEGEA